MDTPAPPPMPSSERRDEVRFERELPVELHESSARPVPGPLPGRILDISRNGLRVRLWHDAPIGTIFSLSLSFGERDSLCVGKVSWKRDSNNGVIYGLDITHWTLIDPTLSFLLTALEGKPFPGKPEPGA